MLTNKDIEKLTSVLATKKEVAEITKEIGKIKKGMGEMKSEIGGMKSEIISNTQAINEVKLDTESLRESIHELITTVDKLAEPIDTLRTEYYAVSAQLDRHETWIKKSAPKIGVMYSE
ncbi:MAG: hypothetical protein AAB453_03745 [Patescibacteria group bacterium]